MGQQRGEGGSLGGKGMRLGESREEREALRQVCQWQEEQGGVGGGDGGGETMKEQGTNARWSMRARLVELQSHLIVA